MKIARSLRDNAQFLVTNVKEFSSAYGYDTVTVFKAEGEPINSLDSSKKQLEAWLKDQIKLPVTEINSKNSASVLEAKNHLVVMALYPSESAWKDHHKKQFWKMASNVLEKSSTLALGLVMTSVSPTISFASFNGKLYENYAKHVFGFDYNGDAVETVILVTDHKVFHKSDINGKPIDYRNKADLVQAIVDASEGNLKITSMKGSAYTFLWEGYRNVKKSSSVTIFIFIAIGCGVLYFVFGSSSIKGSKVGVSSRKHE